MCGFVGAVSLETGEVQPDTTWLERATRLLWHRGPDSGGSFIEGPLMLGARRLRIHDLDARADQPMADLSDRYRIVLNGAIFNYKELREELRTAGARFATESDTEVALAALAHWGRKAFTRFDGMFAIAFYDRAARKLLIGRDKLGIKPLYVHAGPSIFLFASEIKPILQHPAVPRRLNRSAVSEFFAFQALMPPKTLFEGIESLEPGHGVEIDLAGGRRPAFFCYWRVEEMAASTGSGPDVMEALEISLKRCWNADRHVGIQLSGGVDSSLVTAISRERLGIRDIDTYSVIFDDSTSRYYKPRSEEAYIRTVADKYGLHANMYCFDEEAVRPALAESIWFHEAPLNGPSTCLYMLLARAIHKDVTVLLTGEGADDIFLGYFNDWNFSSDPRALFKQFVNSETLITLFGRAGAEAALESRLALAESEALAGLSPRRKATVMTIKGYLHGLLARHDRMFMAYGIEGRPPFCTDEVLAARFALDDDLIQDGKTGKRILKELASRYFGHDFAFRTKIGFSSPFGDWCSDPRWWRGYYDRLSLDFVAEFADPGLLKAQIEMAEGVKKWSGQTLNMAFSWMNFQLWHEIFIASADPADTSSWRNLVPGGQSQPAQPATAIAPPIAG